MLSGRGIDRENNSDAVIGHRILNDLLMVSAAFKEEEKKIIERIVKREIEKYGSEKYLQEESYPFMYQQLSDFLENKEEMEKYKREVKVFNNMDRIMSRQEKSAIGIAMHSSKTGNYETMNGENIKGWYTGDGAYYLYDDESSYTDYWKNVDMYFIPGTTEIEMDMENIDAQRNFETSFVPNQRAGGVSAGDCGVGAMEFLNWNEKLKSRKSWFFTDRGVIFAESGITGTGKIYTTVFNRKYEKLPEIEIDGQSLVETEFNGEIQRIKIGKYKISFYKKERINIVIEEKVQYKFVKIWKEYKENPVDEVFLWGLFDRGIENEWDNIGLLINEKEHSLKDGKYKYNINWKSDEENMEFCTIKKL